jgi:hypothetical protein
MVFDCLNHGAEGFSSFLRFLDHSNRSRCKRADLPKEVVNIAHTCASTMLLPFMVDKRQLVRRVCNRLIVHVTLRDLRGGCRILGRNTLRCAIAAILWP